MSNKKHFICTHTWNNPESRKIVNENTKGMTDKIFFESLKSIQIDQINQL